MTPTLSPLKLDNRKAIMVRPGSEVGFLGWKNSVESDQRDGKLSGPKKTRSSRKLLTMVDWICETKLRQCDY